MSLQVVEIMSVKDKLHSNVVQSLLFLVRNNNYVTFVAVVP